MARLASVLVAEAYRRSPVANPDVIPAELEMMVALERATPVNVVPSPK